MEATHELETNRTELISQVTKEMNELSTEFYKQVEIHREKWVSDMATTLSSTTPTIRGLFGTVERLGFGITKLLPPYFDMNRKEFTFMYLYVPDLLLSSRSTEQRCYEFASAVTTAPSTGNKDALDVLQEIMNAIDKCRDQPYLYDSANWQIAEIVDISATTSVFDSFVVYEITESVFRPSRTD